MLALINENRLDQWVRSNAQEAQGIIVELIWRLVVASCPKAKERRFPLSDSIGQHGPDGILDTPLGFEPFVPEGLSYWEIGTSLDARQKATSDYKKLTENVPENVRKNARFVFVTPLSGRRGWEYTWKQDAQADWLEKRRKEGEWKDVRVIDGTKLTDWLHHFPAIELWLVEKISGLSGIKVETPEHRWHRLSSLGRPRLPPTLFLANRRDACEKLREVLDRKTAILKLTTHYPEQVIDFVAAYLASLDDENRIEAYGRCLIVSDVDNWNMLCSYYKKNRNFVLIATPNLDLSGELGAELIQKAETAGHAVIFSAPQGGIPDSATIRLYMPHGHEIYEELTKAGYNEVFVRKLVQKSGGNLTSLLRLLLGVSVEPEWAKWTEAGDLTITLLLGAWDDESEADRKTAEALVEIPYKQWIEKIREITLRPYTPLIQRNRKWKFIPRYEGWYALGPRLFDEHLERLKHIAVSVLRERDPQFDLPKETRYAAQIYGKVLRHSHLLRNGLAESLALLGSHPKALTSFGKAETTARLAVREILQDADWVLWASLNDVHPLLAEAAPEEFLDAVEKALRSDPCPFDEIFAQEGDGIFGSNYMTGLLWALEGLAWDEQHLIRVCVALGELASRDPGGQWADRPFNSLITILLPWFPQTTASIEKRKAAVKTLFKELSDIAWNLIIQLLSGQHQSTFGSYKPRWRETIPDNWKERATQEEYREQVSFYAELAVDQADHDIDRLSELVDHLDKLPKPAFDKLLEILSSGPISELPEEQRISLWEHLIKLINQHRRSFDAEWALSPELINRVEEVAKRLAPGNPFYLHRYLFTDRDFDQYEENDNWEEQTKKLQSRRDAAIQEIFEHDGVEGVIRFANSVDSPEKVGFSLGTIPDSVIDRTLLPDFLDVADGKRRALVSGFIWRRYQLNEWVWCDKLDKSDWKPEQIGQLLAYLPFTKEAWHRVSEWLQTNEREYWISTSANAYQAEGDLSIAVDKLIEYGRPFAAIGCLSQMLHNKQQIDVGQCVRALLAALSTREAINAMNRYNIVELIKFIQEEPSVNPNDLLKIEWAYLPLLDGHYGAVPKLLENRLANDPKFFCEVIRLVYRSKREEEPSKEPREKEKAFAKNAWKLLYRWKTPPGMQDDGTFNNEHFTKWLKTVKKICTQSGHLEVALSHVGQVLIHTPPDPSGLWIYRAAADALNASDADHMRDGFRIGTFNSRSVHWVDPEGKPEKELAENFQRKAEQVENAGFHRLAATLKSIAEFYDHEAERIIAEHRQEESDWN